MLLTIQDILTAQKEMEGMSPKTVVRHPEPSMLEILEQTHRENRIINKMNEKA